MPNTRTSWKCEGPTLLLQIREIILTRKKCHLYKIHIRGKHINDVFTETYNPAYDVILNFLDNNPSTAQEEPHPAVVMRNSNAEQVSVANVWCWQVG
jgi:hypothetical protein